MSESPLGSGRSSPEAELGSKLEDIWASIDEPQLTPTEKLNNCFDGIPVSAFPPAPSSQVIEIPSDATLAEAVEVLSKNRIMRAPVRNVEAAEDSTWIDRYIGIVEFAGIAIWLLRKSESTAAAKANNGVKPQSNNHNKADQEDEVVGQSFFGSFAILDLYKNTEVL